MILNVFLNLIRNAIWGDSVGYPLFFAVGSGTTPAAASDTGMETEVYPDGFNRSAISSKTKSADKQVSMYMTMSAGEGNGNTLTECGISNAVTGGTFANRFVHTGIVKTAAFELRYVTVIDLMDV